MRSPRLLWLFVIVLATMLGGLAYSEYHTRQLMNALDRRNKELGFLIASALDRNEKDEISLNVGTIQFLRRGYSIRLDSIEYGSNGLTLTGQVGNPTQLWISNLSINFVAATPFDFDDWMKSKPEALLKVIGTGQTPSINTLAPGKTTTFRVTIPNLRQVPDGKKQPAIFVNFSGELYSYPT